jgi:hypothetical protein
MPAMAATAPPTATPETLETKVSTPMESIDSGSLASAETGK